MKNSEYRLLYSKFSFDVFKEHACDNRLIERLKRVFNYSYQDFLKDFDFEVFEWPDHPEKLSPQEWDELRDYLSDCESEMAEAKAFKKFPQSVDPINF